MLQLLCLRAVCAAVAAVCTRPSSDKNALGQDEAHVQQELEMPVSASLSSFLKEETTKAAARAAIEFDGGLPLAFLSVLHIHERLKHDLRSSINPFRVSDGWTAPQNTIRNAATPVVLKRPCITVMGTAVLPLVHLLAASKKTVQRLDWVNREHRDPMCVTVGADGRLKLMERLKLFHHDVRNRGPQ